MEKKFNPSEAYSLIKQALATVDGLRDLLDRESNPQIILYLTRDLHEAQDYLASLKTKI